MSEPWEGQLPNYSGSSDEIEISGIVPTLAIQKKAAKLVKRDTLSKSLHIQVNEAGQNVIRLCIRNIAGEAVNFTDLQGSGLEDHICMRQLALVGSLFDMWQSPTEIEKDTFVESVHMGGRNKFIATLPDGRVIEGLVPSSEILGQAMSMIEKSAKKSQIIMMMETRENKLRLCVTSIDGESVDKKILKGSKLESYLSLKEMTLLADLFDDWETPEVEDKVSFLDSVQIGKSTTKSQIQKDTSPDELEAS